MAERLQKYLARAGVASRRHAEELITAGRITVNNQTVTELGTKVSPGDLVTVDGKLVTPPEESSYYVLYKPVGVVTTLSDPQGRPTVADYLEEAGKRLFPVGRLDYDAEGALLVTDDGALAHKLTHPSFQVPRTYLAKVKGSPDAGTLEKLRGGVRLEDGMATPVSVDVFEQAERNTWLKLVVAEGRPHLIKRLCAAVGSPVVRLFRPSYAGITVDGVRPGELKPLTQNQVRMLQEVADGKASPPERDLKLPPRRHGRSAPGFETGADMDDEDFSEAPPAPARKRAAAEKPARGTRPERPERKPARAERPARAAAGRPERKELAPRGEGGSRPAFRSATGERAERRTWTPREDEQEQEMGLDEGVEQAPRAEERGARPERREWAPRGESRGGERGARPARKSFGAGEGAERGARPARKPFGAGEGAERGARPVRKSFGAGAGAERGARPARKPFGAGAGAERGARPARKPFGAGEGAERGARPARKPFGAGEGAERGARPARRPFGAGEGAERGARPARKPFGVEGAERGGRPARKPFGAGEGAERRAPARGARPERREWAPRGEERGERPARPERREWAPRGEGRGGERGARPERKSFGPSDERRAPARGERPERREWAPRGEGRGGERGARPERKSFGPSDERRVPARGGGRPERREWAPRGEESARPARRGAARPEGEGAGEGAKPFVNWRAKKHPEPKPGWDARPSRGAGGPRGRGPRKGR